MCTADLCWNTTNILWAYHFRILYLNKDIQILLKKDNIKIFFIKLWFVIKIKCNEEITFPLWLYLMYISAYDWLISMISTLLSTSVLNLTSISCGEHYEGCLGHNVNYVNGMNIWCHLTLSYYKFWWYDKVSIVCL